MNTAGRTYSHRLRVFDENAEEIIVIESAPPRREGGANRRGKNLEANVRPTRTLLTRAKCLKPWLITEDKYFTPVTFHVGSNRPRSGRGVGHRQPRSAITTHDQKRRDDFGPDTDFVDRTGVKRRPPNQNYKTRDERSYI